ncbi:tetraprenyl-beta-curcumene synthase family protein [Cytobacillus gottheilii]|uniref:tetraprenyl-beta-curcumene synthase family protein n=1 Tax=Cytobacillus gottheilii TaxID=859144 RepID=UPI0009BB5C1A|nr:tetraprenyl-beta-curcumene synthase family protein [Cytobacillus gottheilii]
MSVPSMPISLMTKVYRRIFPVVHAELKQWRIRAEEIPNQELRKQALASIDSKTFHCEGGSIMALIAMENYKDAIQFIVAYQTISDYLDNLCDRSTSLDPADFSALHEAMEDALSLHSAPRNRYYRFREDQNDGGYLEALVASCRETLSKLQNYNMIQKHLLELSRFYCDLQIHKHVTPDERVPRLQKWHSQNKEQIPNMEWYEFSACSGSTLGIFCLVSYALREDFLPQYADHIREGYFPYIQGLHILLDYLIDQEEDRAGGDLNFCFYYESEQMLFNRLRHFVQEADKQTSLLPHSRFHHLINRGLLGVYLSDDKVRKHTSIKRVAKNMIKTGGMVSYFFYWNGRIYRTLQKWLPLHHLKPVRNE